MTFNKVKVIPDDGHFVIYTKDNNIKFNEIFRLIDLLKFKFSNTGNIKKITVFFSEIHYYFINFKSNFKIPHLEIKLTQGNNLTLKTLTLKYAYPKINLIQSIYCEFMHNNVSNNNVLAYVNMKSKYLTEPIKEIVNITNF